MNKVTPLRRYLDKLGGSNSAVLQRARVLARLAGEVERLLGPALKGHVQLANVDNGTATLLVDSHVWATRLRYMAPELTKRFQDELPRLSINKVSIRIARLRAETETATHRHRAALSKESAVILEKAALGFADSELRDALLRLSRRSDDKSRND